MAESLQPKRRKTLLACEYCRNKKTKCDGRRPICGACQRRGWGPNHCLWRHVDGKEDVVPMTLVQNLERRIQDLERQGGASTTPQNAVAYVSTSSLQANSPDMPDPSPSSVSAMEGAVTGEPQTEGFVGPAAAAAFMDTVRRAVDPQSAAKRATPRGRLSMGHADTISPTHFLPVRQEADVLVRSYWIYVHPIYPCLYKPTFEAIYASLWSGLPVPAADLPIMQTTYTDSICLVNLVLSLSCQYAPESDINHDIRHGSRQAAVYFEGARLAFHYDPLDDGVPSLQRAQVLLLMVQYLKSVGSTHKAWDVIGLAIRTCQRLGLHIPATSTLEVMPSFADREMVKRVWHGCVMIEIMLSATLGRPAMISAADVASLPLPSEVDEELFQSHSMDGTYTSENSAITFFVLSVGLFELVQRILLTFYSEGQGDATDTFSQYFTGTDSVLTMDSQMSQWRKSVPPHLQLEDDGLSPHPGHAAGTFTRQAAVLRIRYLQARIYLFRPVLSQTCMMHHVTTSNGSDPLTETTFATSLHRRVAIQCSLMCIAEAIDLIETMYANHTTAETWGQKPSWLYGVLHIYLAATVLLAARLAPDVLLTEVSEEQFQTAWDHALAILRRFQADSVSANRCVSALETLYRKLPIGSKHTELHSGSHDNTITELEGIEDDEVAQFAAHMPPPPSDAWTVDGAEVPFGWVPGFDLSDPYDMSWFMASESFA